ncbi:iron chelate uptake ABC transporter family permease subunit [Acetobacterium paludosum]|uniref:Iron chelate uptake ABC transporter family permease subunit n=1 Tax=Acetobacterium paludosum TaxID=52693 RepID=A0A923HTV2_9FIRM|nr:iron ABC transporter permease [Acetobacterium paludosum]MBC3887097.1 iron chelate uptake ABC transporter family permease subunit [Acetobacterium paludosum]
MPRKITSKSRNMTGFIILIMAVALLVIAIGSLAVGRYALKLDEIFAIISNRLFGVPSSYSEASATVLINVRTPRLLAAIFVGAALSVAGAAYQGLFRNPMVSPDLLGASAGAGFGAAISLLLGRSMIEVQIVSFLFGLTAVAITYAVGSKVSRGDNSTMSLVLTGIVVSSLFQAFITIIKYVADPNSKLPTITYWLMGGLNSIGLEDLPLLVIPILIGLIPMLLLRYKLNLLAFGDEEAKAIGVDTKKLRLIFVITATLVTSASVAACGMIGWVGLVIPHLARMIVGPNYKTLLPVSVLLGAIFLLLIDNVSRCLFSVEIPLSVLTALFGAPFFLSLLMKGKKGWV